VPTYTTWIWLERNQYGVYKVMGERESVPGGCFYVDGRSRAIKPIVITPTEPVGVRLDLQDTIRITSAGWISQDRSQAFIRLRSIVKDEEEEILAGDTVKIEVQRQHGN
jgi:hypothetical protein